MSIYTRTGDDGSTALYGGKRLSKADVQIEAYGSLDELTCTLGVFISTVSDREEAQFIEHIQKDLYVVMGWLANAPSDLSKQKKKVELFEKKIDSLTANLPPLRNFIIPSGGSASLWAHMARVGARKAERAVVLYFQSKGIIDDPHSQIVLMYLNRLSDLLFTYARSFNKEKEIISKKI